MQTGKKVSQLEVCRGSACNNSGGTKQFSDERSGETAQLATSIKYGPLTDFKYKWGSGSSKEATGKVGSSMSASLDPSDPKTGTDTSSSDAFNDLFSALQSHTATSWVRGHLLNHDLGGIAMYNNLFPITTAANGEHYHEVEKLVKHWVANGCEVQYDVDARGPKSETDPTGVFDCEAEVTSDPTKDQKFASKKIKKSIFSLPVKKNVSRTYKKKGTKGVGKKNAGVIFGKGNNMYRDEYSAHTKKNNKWNHVGGTSKINNVEVAGEHMGYIDTDSWYSGAVLDLELSNNDEYDRDAINEYMGF